MAIELEMKKDNNRKTFALTRRSGINLLIAFLVSVVAITVIVLFTISDKTLIAIQQVRVIYLIIAFLLTVLSYFLSGLTFSILASALHKRLSVWHSFEVFSGANFIGLTAPFHIANIPVQALFLNNFGISYADATAIVTTHAVLSAWFFAVVTPFIFIFDIPLFGTPLSVAFFTALIVIIVSTVLFILFILRPDFFEKAVAVIINSRLLKRFISPKKLQRFSADTVEYMKNSNLSLKKLFKASPFSLLLAFLSQVLAWIAIIATAPIILIGLNWFDSLLEIFFRVMILNFFLSFSPIPGGSGIAEVDIFAATLDLIPTFLIGPLVLLWRFTTFYLIYGVSAFFFVWLINMRAKMKKKKNIKS